MGRNRSGNADPNRYLSLRSGHYHYHRKVPQLVAHLDERSPLVRFSLKTDDLALARKKRDMAAAADDALWASLVTGSGVDEARLRFEAARKRVEALDFTFHETGWLARIGSEAELARRFEAILTRPAAAAADEPLLGLVDVPKTTVTQAFALYCDEIVADELVGKSKAQRDQWKKVKQRAVNNFVKLVADKPIADITIDDAKKVYRYWLGRIAPKIGAADASASSGNRDIGNMRVLYAAYFKHMGDSRRENPFDGLGFSMRKKRSRPPLPTEWIRDTIMRPGALASLNEEARGILLILIETGARPSEICNLNERSIRLVHKVPHIAIEPRDDPDDPREIKTLSSERQVPLVGVALEAARRHAKGFPHYRNRENDLSATLNKFLRSNGLLPPAGKHTVYSLRHSFEDRMKVGGLDDELRRITLGHAINRPRYGAGGTLEWRRDELNKIALPFDHSIV